ncbi:hypothetical protein Tco_0970727 [Tanacetum coccineum]
MSEEDQPVDVAALPKRAILDAMAWRHQDLDVNDPAPEDGFSALDVQALTERVIDLRYVPFSLLFQGGLATTWDFPGFRLVFKDTEGNVIIMSKHLRFPFVFGATIEKGIALTSRDQRVQHTAPPLPVDQVIPDRTGHQKEVEVKDPKIIAIRERKARVAAKKIEKKKRGADEGEGSYPKVKRKKTSAVWKDSSAASDYVSSLEPILKVNPTRTRGENPSEAAAANAESREDRSLHSSPHGSANHSVHDDTDVYGDEGTNSLRLSFIDQSGRNLNTVQTEVFQSSPGDHSVYPSPTDTRMASLTRSEWESSRNPTCYVPEWFIHRRCRIDTPMWCRELMVHLAPPAAQEDSNSLNNATALERAWFALG